MGVAGLNEKNHLLMIKAHIILYGDAASEELARIVAAEIQTHWNQPEAQVLIRNRPYDVVFQITAAYNQLLVPDDIYENDNALNNYFRVEEFSEIDISFVDGIGSNTGYFKLDNLLNSSTTAAHEFGHTIGLEHPRDLDIRGGGVPGIMYPRGTLVDAHFQYDPSATAGSTGGTLNPAHRKVTASDIRDLQLHRLHFDKYNRAVLGDFSSTWHPKHIPHPHH